MPDRQREDTPFDEGAALEELERVRKEIARYQSERQAVEEEFDRFTASFKPLAAASAPPPVPRPPVALPVVPPVSFDPIVLDETVEPIDAPPPVPDALVTKELPAPPPRRRSPAATLALLTILLVLLGAAGYVTWLQRRAATPSPSAPVTAAPVQQPPAVAEPPAPAPAARPPQASPFESIVTTTRPVWVRVIADGVPVIERELPADARVPFIAREAIVIRTGDAGAVRVTIGGVDQGPLGRLGEVVTRRFDVRR